MPRGHVAGGEVLGSERRHVAHSTIVVVGIPDRILGAALRGDIVVGVVGRRRHESNGIRHAGLAAERVVAVGGRRARGIGCGDEATCSVIGERGRVAASVGHCDHAAKSVVVARGKDSCRGSIGNRVPADGERPRGERRGRGG